jgi:large subunit ribosomal protein L25
VPEVKIAAESRTQFGKGAARRLRREGKVPGVLYGHGSDPVHIALPDHDLMLALKTSNVLLEVHLEGKDQLALPKQVQRDPVRHTLEHVDLLIVRRGEKVHVEVPINVTGTVVPGGLLDTILNTIEVEAEATHIPQSLEVDVEGLEVGGSIHAGQIALPSGTVLITDPEATVLHVLAAQTAEQYEAELAGEPAEGEAAAGEAGAETAEAADDSSSDES